MNTRWVRIGLLLLVATVWGAVLVKAFFKRPRFVESIAPLPSRELPRQAARIAPALNLHWARDPFLHDQALVQRVSERSSLAPIAARPVVARPRVDVAVAWPQVVYKGALNASGPSEKRVAMLTINSREVIMRTGQEQEGLKLVAVGADSVALRLGGNDRVFPRTSSGTSTSTRSVP